MKIIDFRSDTVTKPSEAMWDAMRNAPLGDDVFAEDPSVAALEQKVAQLFGMESALFCPSGTMTNQIAVKMHTQPLDEVIGDALCHIYNYETGGWAFHSGVSMRLIQSERGYFGAAEVAACVLPDHDWFPNSRLVCVENTINRGGGSVYPLDLLRELSAFCKSKGLKYHLDGARVFNALATYDYGPEVLHGLFDSVSVCLSKGLGTPAGSVLAGNAADIKRARKIRKVMGGGMRQSGILAAAGIYALENNVNRLAEDHIRAQRILSFVLNTAHVTEVLPVETNIIIFRMQTVELAEKLQHHLESLGIKISLFGGNSLRIVTHLDVNDDDVEKLGIGLKSFS